MFFQYYFYTARFMCIRMSSLLVFFPCISYKCIYVPFSNIVLYFAQYYIDIYIYIYIYNKNIDIDVLTCICVVSFRKGIQLIIVSTVYCLLFIHRITCVLVDK